MVGKAVVPADILFPDLPPTKFIATLNGVVLFSNFAVDSAAPVKPFHTDFIAQRLVPFLIAQIDKLGFADQSMTLHLFGFASATGTAAHNLVLSRQRAQAIGAAISAEFDRQKGRSTFAGKIQTVIDPHGEGDEVGRLQLAAIRKLLGHAPSSAEIEAQEFALRSVRLKIQAQHDVVDDDKKVLCRQMFSVKFDVQKVPANLLEQKLNEIEINPFFKTLLGDAFKVFIGELKTTVKEALKTFEFEAPEIAILFESIDFIIPSDIELAFQFKDSRGRIATYRFTGSENKKNVTLLDALSKLMSALKWAKDLEKAMENFANRSRVVNVLKLDKLLRVVVRNALKEAHSLFDKGGSLRPVIGDEASDILLAILELGGNSPLTFDTSDFFPVVFDSPGVFDVSTFNKPARTETREFLGKANVRLDFLGEGPEGRLGFHATTLIQNRFSFNTGLIGFGFSKGFLKVQSLPVR